MSGRGLAAVAGIGVALGCVTRSQAPNRAAAAIPAAEETRPRVPESTAVGSGTRAGLQGVIDTIILVSAGSPFGAAVSTRGMAYVTLHSGVAALASWDFKERRAVEHAVLTGVEPTNVAFDPEGTHAFVACQWSSSLERVDVTTSRIDSEWATPGNDPFQVAITGDGKTALVSGNSSFLHVFDARSGELRHRVAVREAPNGLAVSADGRRVFLTHLRSREVGVVDLVTGAYHTLAVMDGATGQGVVLSRDERVVFALSQEASRLYAYDAGSGALLGSVGTSAAPFGLALTPDGSELWVTTLGGTLQRFTADGALRLRGETQLGGRLRRIAMDPKGRGAVVADEEGRILVLR